VRVPNVGDFIPGVPTEVPQATVDLLCGPGGNACFRVVQMKEQPKPPKAPPKALMPPPGTYIPPVLTPPVPPEKPKRKRKKR